MPKSSAALISGDSKILMRLFEGALYPTGALINEYKKSARKKRKKNLIIFFR